MSWVEVNGAGWRWVHDLVIPTLRWIHEPTHMKGFFRTPVSKCPLFAIIAKNSILDVVLGSSSEARGLK